MIGAPIRVPGKISQEVIGTFREQLEKSLFEVTNEADNLMAEEDSE